MNEKSINQKSILQKALKTMVFAIFLFSFLAASSQDTLSVQDNEWTLEECINYALEHNIDIKKQLLLVQGQEDQLLQSKLGMLPSLNAGATHGYNWGNTVDRYTNEFATTRVQSNNFYLGTQFNLFQGLQQVNAVNQNKLDWLASQYDLDLMMDDISIAVAGYYLDILYNQELLAVAREQLAVTKQQVTRMDKMVQAGTLARGDLLNMEAQAATEELLVIEAENRLAISIITLQQLIDLPVSMSFKVDVPDLKPVEAPQVTLTPQDVYSTALINRPEIKSAEYRVQSAEKGISIARGYLSPTLSFNGTWATGYSGAAQQENGEITTTTVPIGYLQNNPAEIVVTDYDTPTGYTTIPFDSQLNDNQNKSLQLSLQIPIFNGWQARTAISQAIITKEDASLNLQNTKLQLNKTIQLAYADAVAALKNYNASEKKLRAQQEAFKYSQQKLDVGMLTAVDYNETKKELVKAESDLLQAKYRFIYTTTVLDFYMGNPITLNK
jgi:outer membrane protein